MSEVILYLNTARQYRLQAKAHTDANIADRCKDNARFWLSLVRSIKGPKLP